MAQMVKNLPAMWVTWVQSLGWEDPLEKGMGTHSSILTWKISWTVARQDFPGKNTRVGCHVLLQGIFLTQGLNLSLLCLVGRFFTTSAINFIFIVFKVDLFIFSCAKSLSLCTVFL